MDEVAENSDALMERYLEGEEISHDEIVAALKDGTTTATSSPSPAASPRATWARSACSTPSWRTSPRPSSTARSSSPTSDARARRAKATCSPTSSRRAPTRSPGGSTCFRVYQGVVKHDTQVVNSRTQSKERIGQLIVFEGKETGHADDFGPGDIGAVAKLKETKAGDWLLSKAQPVEMPQIKLPAPVMAFAVEPKAKGDEEKVFSSLRRLQEEDPTIDLHRDPQTGDQIVAGLSQVHVEVIVERMKSPLRRRGRPQAAAGALHRDDPRPREGSRPPQEAERRARAVRRLPHRDRADARRRGVRVREQDQGRRHPQLVHPRGREGRARGHAARDGRGLSRSRACGSRCSTASTTRWTRRRSPSSWPAPRR